MRFVNLFILNAQSISPPGAFSCLRVGGGKHLRYVEIANEDFLLLCNSPALTIWWHRVKTRLFFLIENLQLANAVFFNKHIQLYINNLVYK